MHKLNLYAPKAMALGGTQEYVFENVFSSTKFNMKLQISKQISTLNIAIFECAGYEYHFTCPFVRFQSVFPKQRVYDSNIIRFE